jgi:hypothetical protein
VRVNKSNHNVCALLDIHAAISREWAIEWTKVNLLPIETSTVQRPTLVLRLQLGPTPVHRIQLGLTCPPQMFACISPAQIQTTVRNYSALGIREFVYECVNGVCGREREGKREGGRGGEREREGWRERDFVERLSLSILLTSYNLDIFIYFLTMLYN